MKRIIVLGMVALGCATLVQAQEKKDGEKLVVYKWYQKGRAHYAKVPPHGVTNYVKLNEYGIVLTERPDTESFQVLRPKRRDGAEGGAQITPVEPGSKPAVANTATAQTAVSEAPPPGTITREERCKTAQDDLNVMNTKKSIYEEDSNGNLIPLSAEDVENRKSKAQQDISSFCN